MGMKNRSKGIRESFVLNTSARRASILADQERAHHKLLKRQWQKRETGMGIAEEGKGGHTAMSVTKTEMKMQGEVTLANNQTEQGRQSSREALLRQMSLEIFEGKKAMVKNYAASQALHRQLREDQHEEAKAALAKRMRLKKQNKKVPTEDNVQTGD